MKESKITEMLLKLCFLITSLVGINSQSSSYYCGNTVQYNGSSGVIYSPNYPSNYYNGINCTYKWIVPELSSASLIFQYINTEQSSSCSFDYVEFSCRSHSVALPSRFCGTGSNLNAFTFSLCSEVIIRFKTDGSVTGGGYIIRYRADPIVCARYCTLRSNAYGYICSCPPNDTTSIQPTPAPNPRCITGCSLQSSYPPWFCNCPVAGSLYTTSRYTTSRCMPPCTLSYDYYGYPICSCSRQTTTTRPCPSGCYRTTDWLGYPYCNCPNTTSSPLSCSYGCYLDADFWGNQFCNCERSTQSPMWCSSGCFSDINIFGSRYCRCPTTTLPTCYSPCYYTWDYTYDYSGRRICYCPANTTTSPPATGCGQTLTASAGIVTSPNYPNDYPRGTDCYQYISVPMTTTLTVRVLDINVYYSSGYSCAYDYVEITGCDGTITQFCAAYTIPTSGLVYNCRANSLVTIRFHSYYYHTHTSYRGFKLSYNSGFATDCSNSANYLYQGSSGMISSPGYPSSFPAYSECFHYLYTTYEDLKVRITFEQLTLEDSTTCTNVFIKLTCLDGGENTRTVCGSRIPDPMTFQCRTLQIWFRSNATTLFYPRNYRLSYYASTSSLQTTSRRTTSRRTTWTRHFPVGETDLPQQLKLGIGLGAGIGGFVLIILIVVIIVVVVSYRRQAARRDQRHLDELTVVCRSVNSGSGSADGDSVRFWRAPDARESRQTEVGFTNPLIEQVAEEPPSYSADSFVGGAENQSLGGFVAGEDEEQLIDG